MEKANRNWIFWGLTAALPIVMYVILEVTWRLDPFGPLGSSIPISVWNRFGWLLVLLVVAIELIAFLIHCIWNKDLSTRQRIVWGLSLITAHVFVFPFYVWFCIKQRKPQRD